MDCIIAANMAGADGEIIGVDMTQEMVDKAQSNVAATGVKNVTIKRGIFEEFPVDDGWIDLVISNGAINLASDKDDIFRELNWVLKPGSRLHVADIVVANRSAGRQEKHRPLDRLNRRCFVSSRAFWQAFKGWVRRFRIIWRDVICRNAPQKATP